MLDDANFGLLIFIGIVVFSLILGSYITTTSNKCNAFCKEKGWDSYNEVELFSFKDKDAACYKDVPDESGLGTKRIYSGYVSISECTK